MKKGETLGESANPVDILRFRCNNVITLIKRLIKDINKKEEILYVTADYDKTIRD